jgi:hypothetical protein
MIAGFEWPLSAADGADQRWCWRVVLQTCGNQLPVGLEMQGILSLKLQEWPDWTLCQGTCYST